jgi:cytochrome c oxidase cbb3-type subunit 3
MKFINYLESVTGVGIYPLTSLLIFFVFFAGVVIFIVKGRKEYFDMLSGLPLNSNNSNLLTPNSTEHESKTV